MEKKLLACPKCGAFFSVKNGKPNYKCENCSATLEEISIPYETWEGMSEAERSQYKNAYRQEKGCDELPLKKREYYKEVPESSWTAVLGCLGWLIVIGGVAGAVLMAMNGQFLLAVVPLAAGIMSAAIAMVLKEAAEDARATRNMLQKYINNQR